MATAARITADQSWELQNALLAYCTAVDALDDLDGIADLFTEDATLDLSGILLPVFEGRAAIRAFYGQVFEDMSHHMHILSNFRVAEYTGDEARCKAYVTGMGRSHAGIDVKVYVHYDLRYRRTPAGWKIAHFFEAPQLPMPDSVTAVHAR